MIDRKSIRLKRNSFENVFIVDDRNKWNSCILKCNKELDLVLCVDFALKKQLKDEGFNVAFLDHLVDENVLNSINLEMNTFLYKWCKDAGGQDLLAYGCFNIGEALLLNLMTDVTYFCHFFFNVLALKSIEYKQLQVATGDATIIEALNKAGLKYWLAEEISAGKQGVVYYFPIKTWMTEAINGKAWKSSLKILYNRVLDTLVGLINLFQKKNQSYVYIQEYHPTSAIISKLIKFPGILLVLPEYPGLKGLIKNFSQLLKRRKVVYKDFNTSREAIRIFEQYKKAEKYNWVHDSYVISDYLYEIIDSVIEKPIYEAVSKAKSIKRYFDRHTLKLMIPVTDFWLENRLIANYAHDKKVPVFFIANGLLNTPYLNEGRDSDFVNCYSESIKEDYFNSAPNALVLGDPRMDKYAATNKKDINREHPTIIIGAAGYDVTDINSYLAYEFDFLYDVLKSINLLVSLGRKAKVILKVRANGYAHLYSSFVTEYFSNLEVEVIQHSNFYDLIQQADLYISIFSQTIFEASTLGIPSIYYKKDTQIIYRPFDSKSELLIAHDTSDLVDKIKLFYEGSEEFELFMDKKVIEKYVGPLDGGNTQRNIDFITKIIDQNKVKIL